MGEESPKHRNVYHFKITVLWLSPLGQSRFPQWNKRNWEKKNQRLAQLNLTVASLSQGKGWGTNRSQALMEFLLSAQSLEAFGPGVLALGLRTKALSSAVHSLPLLCLQQPAPTLSWPWLHLLTTSPILKATMIRVSFVLLLWNVRFLVSSSGFEYSKNYVEVV